MAELFIFGRFHARAGCDEALGDALRTVIIHSREEDGCLSFHAFRSVRDPGLFYIHSRWADEGVFDRHAELPHTVEFLKQVEALCDEPRDVKRTRLYI